MRQPTHTATRVPHPRRLDSLFCSRWNEPITVQMSRSSLMTAIGLLAGTLAIYVLRLNGAAGLMVDDGWYILLAKSLAEGTGYRMISSPFPEVVPLYPPGFSALLSLVFHISPAFPGNVALLKSVSIAAMLGIGFLTYVYLRGRELSTELAACAALAVVITPAFVFLATSTVMSECVFTLSQLAAVVLIQRSVTESSRRAPISTIAAGLATAGAVLVRSAGLTIALAIGLWLLKERLWKRAILFGAVVAIGIVPWMLFARANAPTPEQQTTHGGSIVYSYGEQIWMRWAGDPASGTVTVRDIPARIGVNVVDVFARGMGGIFAPSLLRSAAESGEEMVALGGSAGLGSGSMGSPFLTMVISSALSTLAFVGFVQTARNHITVAELLVPISLSMIFLWPFWSFRFVMPLTPYLFFYVITGIRTIAPLSAVRIALLCVIGLHVFDHAKYVIAARGEQAPNVSWLVQANDTRAALEWMTTHLDDGLVATTNPALVHLSTGHKTLSFDRPHEHWNVWRARGVRYVACLLAVELPSESTGYKLLYRGPSGFWVIELYRDES